jgi:hypothetical protein
MTTPNNKALFNTFWFFWVRLVGREWRHTHLTFYYDKDWLERKHFEVLEIKEYCDVNLIFKAVKK